jgi:hypothetical protein
VTDAEDDELLAALREAMRRRQEVPEEFVAAAKRAFAWRDMGAQTAQLTYDSTGDSELAAGLRSETASIRTLVFTSPYLTIEVEVTEDCLVGQIVPPREGTVEIQTRAGGSTVSLVDGTGCFAFEPPPAEAFRLRCHAADGTDVVTGWVTLRGQGPA